MIFGQRHRRFSKAKELLSKHFIFHALLPHINEQECLYEKLCANTNNESAIKENYFDFLL